MCHGCTYLSTSKYTDTGPLLCCRATFVCDCASPCALLASQDEPTWPRREVISVQSICPMKGTLQLPHISNSHMRAPAICDLPRLPSPVRRWLGCRFDPTLCVQGIGGSLRRAGTTLTRLKVADVMDAVVMVASTLFFFGTVCFVLYQRLPLLGFS